MEHIDIIESSCLCNKTFLLLAVKSAAF